MRDIIKINDGIGGISVIVTDALLEDIIVQRLTKEAVPICQMIVKNIYFEEILEIKDLVFSLISGSVVSSKKLIECVDLAIVNKKVDVERILDIDISCFLDGKYPVVSSYSPLIISSKNKGLVRKEK